MLNSIVPGVPRSRLLRGGLVLVLAMVAAAMPTRNAAPPAGAQAGQVLVSRSLANGVSGDAIFSGESGGYVTLGSILFWRNEGASPAPADNYAELLVIRQRDVPNGYILDFGGGVIPLADVSGNQNSGVTVRTDTSTNPNWEVGGRICSYLTNTCQPFVDPTGGPRGLVDVTWARRALQPYPGFGATETFAGTSGYSWGPFSLTRSSGTNTIIYGAAGSGSVLGVPVWSGGGSLQYGSGVTITLSQQ